MNESNNIESLLPLYCEGRVTEEERMKVEEWLRESDEHRQIARQIEMLYMATDTLKVMEKVDTEKALSKVRSRMKAKREIAWWTWVQRVAAVLFLPLLGAYLVERYAHTDEVQMLEAHTSPGMTAKVVLPDSSVVHLNSDSQLRYPSSFRGEDLRKVELQGEAFFDVQKNPDQQFVVSTSQEAQVRVFGTRFNVEAYEEDSDVTVTLVKGSVGFNYPLKGTRKEVRLIPGEKLVYDSKAGKANLMKTSGEVETAWIDGKIILNNTPAKEVLHILEKRYNVKFSVRPGVQLDGAFTGTFTNQRLERILEYFRVVEKIHWRYLNENEMSEEKTQIEIY